MNRLIDINCNLFSAGNDYVDFLEIDEVERIASAHRNGAVAADELAQYRFGLTPPLYYSLADGIAGNRRVNDALLRAGAASDRIVFGTVEPKFGDFAIAEIGRIAERDAAGVVWSPRAQGLFGNDRIMAEMCKTAAQNGMLSMIHSAPFSVNESLDRIWNLAEACDGAPLVVLGAFASWENIQIVRNNKGGPGNVSYDLTGLSETWDLQALVASIGADRLVFGSGGPRFLSATLNLVEGSALEPAVREAILHGNALRLLKTLQRSEDS